MVGPFRFPRFPVSANSALEGFAHVTAVGVREGRPGAGQTERDAPLDDGPHGVRPGGEISGAEQRTAAPRTRTIAP
jgi:hypothetical protein